MSRRGAAQSLVEFALVAPVLILLAMVAWDGGSVLREQVILQQAARDGARVAATKYAGSYANNAALTAAVQPAVLESTRDLPTLSSTTNYLTVSSTDSGQSVLVSLAYDHALVTPLLRGLWGGGSGTVRLTASATFFLPQQTAVPATVVASTPLPTFTPTPLPTNTPTPTPTPTNTPTPTPVPATPTPTRTPTPVPPTPTPLPTNTPTPTPVPATPTPTRTPTPVPPTPTPLPTNTPTPTPTPTRTPTPVPPTPTPTVTPTFTPTATATATPNPILHCTMTVPALDNNRGYFVWIQSTASGAINSTWFMRPGQRNNIELVIYSIFPFDVLDDTVANANSVSSSTAVVDADFYAIYFYNRGQDVLPATTTATVDFVGKTCPVVTGFG